MPDMFTDDHHKDDGAEFVRSLTACQRKLFAFILSLVRNPSDANDVLQESNVIAWQKRDEYEMGTNFEAWVFTIARFQVMAFRKKQQRSRLYFNDELVELLATDAAAALLDDHDSRIGALSTCLNKLKDEQRKLIARRYGPDGCVNDIAMEQGRSPKAVSEALRRIRHNLKICIEHTLGQPSGSIAID